MTKYRRLPPPEGPCVPFTGHIMKNGYGQKWSFGRVTSAHRAAVEQARGEKLPRDVAVCHRCDNPPCVNLAHLHCDSYARNAEDALAKNRDVYSAQSKLTWRQVRAIKAAPKTRGSGKRLADKYEVSQQCICNIRAGRHYAE